MGRLVKISNVTGPAYFGTAPVDEEERARRLAEREASTSPTGDVRALVLPTAAGTGLLSPQERIRSTLGMPSMTEELPALGQQVREGLQQERRQELEAELRSMTRPGQVYNEAVTAQRRGRAQDIREELSTIPQAQGGRLRSGAQSILTTAAAALPVVGDTAVQAARNVQAGQEARLGSQEQARLEEVSRQLRALEGGRTGEALDYIRSQEAWQELDRERSALQAKLNAPYSTPVSLDAPGMKLMGEAGRYREQALDGLEGVPRFLGETALSIGQNAALLPTAAISPAVPLAAMGAISAADRMYELSERGLPASEALGRGLVSGGIEAATEKIPLDTLLDAARTGGRGALRNILRQAGTEAGEESVSYLANFLADAAVRDPEAAFSLSELAQAAAGGALSGGVFGAGGTAYNALAGRALELPRYRDQADAGQAQTGSTAPQSAQAAPIQEAQTVEAALENAAPGAVQAADTGRQSMTASMDEAGLPRMTMRDFTDVNSSVWNNVAYDDTETQAQIMRDTHQDMVDSGQVVRIPESTTNRVSQSYPDLRALKKSERTPILRQKMNELKASLRQFLNGLKGSSYEFEVNGDILDAKLYDTGVREVMEKVTQDKASMLYHSDEVFQNARYLYSTPDYDGDPNIYRWNYFYTPVQIGDQTVGVRIAVRDIAQGQEHLPESQIYNWGIKTDAALGGGKPGTNASSPDTSSAASDGASLGGGERGGMPDRSGASSETPTGNSISQTAREVNHQGAGKDRPTILDARISPAPEANAQSALSQGPSDHIIPTEGRGVNPKGAGENVPNPGAGPEYLTGPESSVGGAREGFDPWSQFQLSKSEFFPEGANAARPVDVPTTDPQGRSIRKTAATAMGAKAIPDEAVADIQNMVLRGELSYTRKSDRDAIDRAVKTIQDKTYQGALEEFRTEVQRGVISKDVTALGQQLLINAANAGDGDTMAEVLTLYAQMETTAGQAVQAASILRKLSPSSQLYAAQRTVNDLEKTIQKRYKDIKLAIDPALLEEFAQQTDQAGRDRVLDKIYQNVADQIPSTWRDKWNAWRYLAMLANPRTHIRNVAGNFFFQLPRIAKDRVAAAIETGVSAATGGKVERNKTFFADPQLYRAAWRDFDNVRGVLSGNRYNDVKSEIESRRKVFRTKPLEATRIGNSWLLELEDTIFKRFTYADVLAGYLQAHGVTAEQLRTNTADAQVLSDARDYAGREALRATYQDRNAFSDKVVQVANVLGPAGEAVLPFKRTPANILVRGFEYSPAGLMKGLTADLVQVKRGKLSAAEAIDHIAAGLTGSGLFALGALLFAKGIVTSGGGDDEGQDRLNDLTGGQNYALNLGILPNWIKEPLGIQDGDTATLDWMAPEALPFFMGVELVDSLGQGGGTYESAMSALQSISEPMLELSMLQSLNDVIESVSFSENKLGGLASSALISYFTQGVPTIGGQLERSGEDVRMSTYTDKGLRLPTDIQYALGRASARIPGWDYQQTPYIDAWGRKEDTGELWLRMANNFLNPAYTSNSEVTPVDEEIQRLYDATGDAGIVPDRPERHVTVNGERVDLSAEEYGQYAAERGQERFSLLESLFHDPAYQALSDTDKSSVIADVYTYTDAVAKSHITDYEPDGWVRTALESGIDPQTYLLFRAVTSGLTADVGEDGKAISGSKKEKVLDAIDEMDVSRSVKDELYYAAGYAESGIKEAPWH